MHRLTQLNVHLPSVLREHLAVNHRVAGSKTLTHILFAKILRFSSEILFTHIFYLLLRPDSLKSVVLSRS